MDGILIIDKPAGITSHDVVARCRRILRTKKIGHTGTLDPFATGVMVVLVGRATRLAQFLDKDVKEYEAVVRFGFETMTGDLTGEIKESSISNLEFQIPKEKIEEVLKGFRGEIMQTPPMFSAKKVDGQKLYELARKGIEIERKSVKITIFELEIIDFDEAANLKPETPNLKLKVSCSAGTYIRVLAEEIGCALGVGAHLSELRRTKAGNFEIEKGVTLEDLEKIVEANELENYLISMNNAISHLPSMILDEKRIEKTKNGLSSRFDNDELEEDQAVRMIDENNDLVAVGYFKKDEKVVQPKIVLV